MAGEVRVRDRVVVGLGVGEVVAHAEVAPVERQGVGCTLYRALLPLLARQGYVHAYAGITLPNPPSVGLHEALGFRPIGVYKAIGFKLGAWHDVGWWDLTLPARALPGQPAAPVPYPLVARGERA